MNQLAGFPKCKKGSGFEEEFRKATPSQKLVMSRCREGENGPQTCKPQASWYPKDKTSVEGRVFQGFGMASRHSGFCPPLQMP